MGVEVELHLFTFFLLRQLQALSQSVWFVGFQNVTTYLLFLGFALLKRQPSLVETCHV